MKNKNDEISSEERVFEASKNHILMSNTKPSINNIENENYGLKAYENQEEMQTIKLTKHFSEKVREYEL